MNLLHLYKMTPSELQVANTHGHLRTFYVSSRVTSMLIRVRFRQVTKQIDIKICLLLTDHKSKRGLITSL